MGDTRRGGLRWVWLVCAACWVGMAALSFQRVERWDAELTNTPLVGGVIFLVAAVLHVVMFLRGRRADRAEPGAAADGGGM